MLAGFDVEMFAKERIKKNKIEISMELSFILTSLKFFSSKIG
jgi:hypothetical protein